MTLIGHDTAKGPADYNILIYSSPYGSDEGDLILKYQAEEIISSKYDETCFLITLFGDAVLKEHAICKVGRVSTLIVPAKKVKEIRIGMSGMKEAGDRHQTNWTKLRLNLTN